MYNLEYLKMQISIGFEPEYLTFWGHRPTKNGSIGASCLSQWFEAKFEYNGQVYWCMEQFMMAQKARVFGDLEMLDKILNSNSQKEIKNFGRKVKGFNEGTWQNCREGIVFEGNLQKFSQNPKLKSFLLATDEKVLVEASPYDTIWGIGMSANDERIFEPYSWNGLNLLGFTLMNVRQKIKEDV
ncbi:MAG: hypothetical protein ATN36_01755 [Epulopiscium sp. Nele67-Bin005]|nr:MAG: hypothetical protein ATN36_01755 [Epulopiscium sp. Nele67-Bin005]